MSDSYVTAVSPQDLGVDPSALEILVERVQKEVQEGLLPSAQFALARHGRIAARGSFGQVTRLGEPSASTDETLYCVYSATKGITSALAWLLIQEGKLGLEERVADIVPEFGTHGKDVVRVVQLLTHTAGFPRAPFHPAEFLDRDKRLGRFASWRLSWEPGTRFEYHTSSSMYVVAEILERRFGKSYRELVRERIAEPLGLTHMHVGLPLELHGELADMVHVGEALTAQDYAQLGLPEPPVTEVTEDAVTEFNTPVVRQAGIPGGGGTMTASDLALFYQALMTGKAPDGTVIWKPETLELACRVHSGDLVDGLYGKPANRGLGVIVSGDETRNYRGFGHLNSPLAFGHNGAGGQLAWADPATGLSFGYCTNGFDRNALRLGRRGVSISNRAAKCAGSMD